MEETTSLSKPQPASSLAHPSHAHLQMLCLDVGYSVWVRALGPRNEYEFPIAVSVLPKLVGLVKSVARRNNPPLAVKARRFSEKARPLSPTDQKLLERGPLTILRWATTRSAG